MVVKIPVLVNRAKAAVSNEIIETPGTNTTEITPEKKNEIVAVAADKKAATATAKNIKQKLKLNKEEKDRKETFDTRKKERSERFANINSYRESVSKSSRVPNFNWGNNKKGADDAKARHNNRSTASSSSTNTAHASSTSEKLVLGISTSSRNLALRNQ